MLLVATTVSRFDLSLIEWAQAGAFPIAVLCGHNLDRTLLHRNRMRFETSQVLAWAVLTRGAGVVEYRACRCGLLGRGTATQETRQVPKMTLALSVKSALARLLLLLVVVVRLMLTAVLLGHFPADCGPGVGCKRGPPGLAMRVIRRHHYLIDLVDSFGERVTGVPTYCFRSIWRS